MILRSIFFPTSWLLPIYAQFSPNLAEEHSIAEMGDVQKICFMWTDPYRNKFSGET